MATVADTNMGTMPFKSELEYALYLAKQPSHGVPLTKYVQWFANKSKLPVEHVEKHPHFWDSAYLQMFLAQENLGPDGMASLMQRLMNMESAQAKAASDGSGGQKEDHSDDDMPELVHD